MSSRNFVNSVFISLLIRKQLKNAFVRIIFCSLKLPCLNQKKASRKMTLQNQVHSDELIYAVLPDGMTRGALEGLLTDLRAKLGLSASLLNSLLTMIRATRPSDWSNPHVEPICSKMQQDLAHTLGKTARAVRFDEYKLEQRGLIEKRVCANGARKSVSDHFPARGCALRHSSRRCRLFCALEPDLKLFE